MKDHSINLYITHLEKIFQILKNINKREYIPQKLQIYA